MATNPMQKKSRNAFLLGMLIMLLISLLIAAGIYVLVVLPKQKEKEKQAVKASTKQVYVVTTPIESGDEIQFAINVESQTLDTGLMTTDLVNAATLTSGSTAKINLPAGTILTAEMVNVPQEEITNDVRLIEYNMITLPTTLLIGDYIDIRLTLPSGQDYIVVSKAKIIDIHGSTIALYLSEEELLMMNSAVVEAYIMTASNLYAVQYAEAGNQTSAAVTYTPTAEVQALIKYDSNIVTTAKTALEGRFSTGVRTYIDAATGLYATQTLTNVETGIQEQIQTAKEARETYLKGLSGEV